LIGRWPRQLPAGTVTRWFLPRQPSVI